MQVSRFYFNSWVFTSVDINMNNERPTAVIFVDIILQDEATLNLVTLKKNIR